MLNQAPKWANNLERSINLERAAIDVEKRTVPLSFSSETTEVIRWGDVEILDHSPGACDLTQLNDIGVLLFNHNIDMPIGGIETASIVNNRGEAVVRFDDDEESDKIFQKVRSGSLKAVSCRYSVSDWQYLDPNVTSSDGKYKGPCYIARKWKPLEISIVSIPADASVGVGRSADLDESLSDKKNEMRSETNMPIEENTQTTQVPVGQQVRGSDTPPAVTVDPARAANEAVVAERSRVADITAMCRTFSIEPDKFIADGITVEAARKAVLERLAEQRPATSGMRITADEQEKFRAAAVDGLLMRGSIVVEKPADGANAFRGTRLLRLAEDCVERATGRRARFDNDEDLIREALTGASAFPGILSATANKSMAMAYQAVPTTFQLWTGTGSNSDFKGATAYRLSEADELEKLTEQGEFKHSEITEASVTKSIATFGRSFSITRKAIIDDDLGALSKIPAKYGAAARRMINKMVYTVFSANPTIEGAALFHANHSNLGTAAAISVASLDKAKAAMAKQKNIGGKEYLNIQPAYLIVPSDLEVTAAQLISSVVDPTKNNATPNPFANKLSVVSDPILSEQSLTAWYLAAAPGMADTIEVTYLNGRQDPTIESQVAFDVLGMKWRIYLDVGVNLLDFRGLFKNPGA